MSKAKRTRRDRATRRPPGARPPRGTVMYIPVDGLTLETLLAVAPMCPEVFARGLLDMSLHRLLLELREEIRRRKEGGQGAGA